MMIYLLQKESGWNQWSVEACYDSIQAIQEHRPDIHWISNETGYDDDSQEYQIWEMEVITAQYKEEQHANRT